MEEWELTGQAEEEGNSELTKEPTEDEHAKERNSELME